MITIKSFASGSSGNFYYLTNKKTKLILECGISMEVIRKKIWEFDNSLITDIDGVLLSHSHT